MSSTNKRRFNKTLKMLKSVVPNGSSIFDLGVRNEFSKIMTTNGYKVFLKRFFMDGTSKEVLKILSQTKVV